MRWAWILVPISIGLVGLGLFINGDRAGGGLLRAIGLVVIGIAAVISTSLAGPGIAPHQPQRANSRRLPDDHLKGKIAPS